MMTDSRDQMSQGVSIPESGIYNLLITFFQNKTKQKSTNQL